MFSRQSPVKRKHSEYHDPDYPQEQSSGDNDDGADCSNSPITKKQRVVESAGDEEFVERSNYLHKVKSIVEKEFNREIAFKQQQLVIIGERIDDAKDLLDKLRYALVASYYKKQELPFAAVDSSTLRGTQTLFTWEDKGPQMQIHPSLKKLIGKKPKNLSEVIRSCPKRTAAQNAVQTIRAKSEIQKREERKLKQIIKGQGIVIDHSIEKESKTDIANLLSAAQRSRNQCPQRSTASVGKSMRKAGKMAPAKPLVGARLNNKTKHLIVVGNTSKSIGAEQDRDSRNNSQILTHKWLVYVQAKDTKVPIERFVTKVRFHLHHSYRPNDIVDVQSPPFHVARRGWGEFPIRVQLYFHQEYHQKPVQLVHNVVLDKTMSGIQTLGAETLLEVWLRNVSPNEVATNETITVQEESHVAVQSKQRVISRSEELVDDNLLEFLNKIEAAHSSISADIEKIHPTVVVSEPLSNNTHSLISTSPTKIHSGNGKYIAATAATPCPLNEIIVNSNIATSGTNSIATIDSKLSTGLPTTLKKIENTTTTMPIAHAVESQGNTIPSISKPQLVINVPSHKQIENTQFHSSPLANKTIIVSSLTGQTITTNTVTTSSEPTATKPKTTFIKLPQNSPFIKIINSANINLAQNVPRLQTVTPAASTDQLISNKKSVVVNKDGKIIMPLNSVASPVRRTILPVVCSSVTISTTNTLVTCASLTSSPKFVSVHNNAPKQILQKKLIQLVDASGKVKYMQMLVAASSTPATPPTASKSRDSYSSVAPKLISLGPGGLATSSITNSTQISRTTSTPGLKLSNGTNTSIMPAGITMKPNIFKIVPENMQTKPQIVTFCTVMPDTNTTTTTTVTSTAPIPIINRATAIGANSSHSPVIVHQKSNGGPMSRNVVFQKEGKVYIIDPLQMKLKQQQKKQVSLLKPQVSLLKQQKLQQQQHFESLPNTVSKPIDHQQVPPASSTARNNAPQLHFGLKQQRLNSVNALQLMQMKRILFEKQFLKQQFNNMRYAIEFILRRLRLVVPKDSLVSAFPFVTNTVAEFQSLTAFKQRAFEWLRAKHVSRLIRSHKDLQRINTNNQESFWSTKEIAQFARQYAYTPAIKSLPKLVGNQEERSHYFKDIVKDELKQKQSTPYDTLTDNHAVFKWVDKVWPTLVEHEQIEDQNQVIDVDTLKEDADEANRQKIKKRLSHLKLLGATSSHENYLSPPSKLENECSLVSEICRDLSVKLMPQELIPNVWHHSTQTVLAQCLNIFLQKLVRNSIALKRQENTATHESTHLITPTDIAKVLSNSAEFDFLTNSLFGSNTAVDTLMPSIKQEKS